MIVAQHEHDPDDDLLYGIDWTDWLGGASITSSTWTSRSGGTVYNESFDGNVTRFQFKDGVDNHDYIVDNLVTLDTGETKELSILIRVRD